MPSAGAGLEGGGGLETQGNDGVKVRIGKGVSNVGWAVGCLCEWVQDGNH